MYIKSISLEGFKSYGTKQEIKGFDPQFNAITGLNGSGKSNILDSICFVLGITNLQQVRCQNLTELVYKNGQAGINKATVIITFDNSDPSTGPLGYEDKREIVITRTVITGGKTKYLINGVSANNNRVCDLFQSVQLNVNNPHFLIMQGRITKVLNMKPMEILSMIEEAAGTRMYEEKKENALKNLDKKDTRLREINTMLNDHICPQLTKLQDEREMYTRYNKTTREYEHMQKIYTAWDHSRTEEILQKSRDEKEKLKKAFVDNRNLIADLKKQIEEDDKRISEIEKAMDQESSSKLQEIEATLKSKQVNEAKIDTQFKNEIDAVKEDEKKQAELQKNYKDENVSLAEKDKHFQNSQKKIQTLKAASDEDSEAIAAAENHFHAVNAGISDEGEESSHAAQLIAAGKERKDAETKQKSLEMSIKHLKTQLAKMESENKRVDESYTHDQENYKKLKDELNKLQAKRDKLGYEEGKFESMVETEARVKKESARFQEEIEILTDRFPQMSFDYTDPVKNFNRNNVYGPVCMLLEMKDPKEAVALEMAASGKLYNIIIEDEQTGKLLLSRGELKRRCTFIPLNKIQGQVIRNDQVREAEHLVGKENVSLALSRISFDKRLTPAMEYVFGNVFICPDMNSAKTVSFSKIQKRSVTLEGEIFDPSGTLSGGSIGNRGKLLSDIVHIPKLKRMIAAKQQEWQQLQSEIQNVRRQKSMYDDLCQQYDLKENEVKLLKSKIEQSTYHKQIEEYQEMKKKLEEEMKCLNECKERQKKAEKLIKELELKTAKNTRESKIQQAEKTVADAKKKAAVSLEKYNAFQAEMNELQMEIESIKEGLPALEQQLEAGAKNIEERKIRLKEIEEKRKEIKDEVAQLQEEVKAQKAVLKSHSAEIGRIAKAKEAKLKQIADAELQMQQMEHDMKNCEDTVSEATKKLKHMSDKNKWIDGQKKYFGVPNSEFDFSNFNPKTAIPRLKELEDLKEELSKKVNTRAQNMLASVEEQYENLTQKKNTVLKDKEVIESVIKELDEQKKLALINACEQVNKDFGSIFRSLLPGTDAKLVPQPGRSVLEGLEFKVAFGKVWKESLSELSGGQKSLVALSLILALLLFNPAPIYILDEVDAALDLSHTQNIGTMLKMHFKTSQFIIVSLKDGMFNNANVLFRTKFSDGMSSVSRTCQKQ